MSLSFRHDKNPSERACICKKLKKTYDYLKIKEIAMQLNDSQKKAQTMRVSSLKQQINKINQEISSITEEMELLVKDKKLDAISEANYKNKIKLLKVDIYDINEKIKAIENPSYVNRNDQFATNDRVTSSRANRLNQYSAEEERKEKSVKNIILISSILLITCFITYTFFTSPSSVKETKDPNQKLIEKQFNPLYGDHLQLKIASKNHLKFPDTYEHIETKYWDNKERSSITVKSYFNGKNAFGVPQRQCLIATYSYSGLELKAPESCI